jgi:hypothetical protein
VPIRESLRGRRVSMSNDRVGGAFEYLRHRGEIDNRGSGNRPSYWLRTVPAEVSDDD